MKTNSQSLYAHLRSRESTVNPPGNFFRQGSMQILSHRQRNVAPLEKYGEAPKR